MDENNVFHTVRGYQLLKGNNRVLTSAMEDYLEMIYRNSIEHGYLRINKLAELLNVRASSASKMVQKLGVLGLINYEKYGIITLTNHGKEIGEFLLERHHIIEEFLSFLGCGEELLIQTELIEHNLNTGTVHNLKILNDFFTSNPKVAEAFMEYRKDYQDIKESL